MRSSRLVLGAVLLATVVSAALTAALASFAGQALPQAAHRQLASADPSIAIQGDLDAAQARRDDHAIRRSMRSAFGATPVTFASAVWSDSLTLGRGRDGGVVRLVQAAASGDIRARVALAAGTWPPAPQAGQPIPAAVPVSVADHLHLSPGDLLAVRDSITGAPVSFRVTGLVRPRNPASPYWRLNVIGASGVRVAGRFVSYGPLLVDSAAFRADGLAVGQASWVVRPAAGRIAARELAALASRITRADVFLAQSPALRGLSVTTDMPSLLTGLADNFVVARSLMAIGLLELVVLAGAALALAARLLASQRQEESALLSARGGARWQLTRLNVTEIAAVAAVAAGAGVLLASPLGRLLADSGPLRAAGLRIAALPAVAWWAAGAAALLSVGIMIWPALHPGSPGAARLRRGRQAPLAGLASAGGDIALVGLALLAGWQLRHYSAVAAGAGHRLSLDPVLTVAPVLALAGGTVAALRLMPAAARTADRLATRGRGLGAAMPSWQISRRPVRQSGPALLIVLAVATSTLVLAQHQSWRRSALDQAAFQAGADVRLDTGLPVPLGQAGSISRVPGVRAAIPVARMPDASGGEILALDARRAAGTVLLRRDLSGLPPAALWGRIIPAGAGPGVMLPGRPERLAISAALGPASLGMGSAQVTVSVQDASGIAYSVPASAIAGDGRTHTLLASLSASRQASYPLRLLSIVVDYEASHPAPARRATFSIGALAVSAGPAGTTAAPFARGGVLKTWHTGVAAQSPLSGTVLPPADDGWRTTVSGGQALSFFAGYSRLPDGTVPPVYGQLTMAVRGPPAIPGIATQAYLQAAHGQVGTIVSLPVGAATLRVKIVTVIAAFPTVTDVGGGLILDQRTTQASVVAASAAALPVTQWWLRTTTPGPPAGLPAGVRTDRAHVADALLGNPLSAGPQQALLAIALAAGVLAAVGCCMSVAASAAERRPQRALLAALGVSRASQARLLSLEQLMLSVPAAAAGVLLGTVIARLLIPAVSLTTAATLPVPPALVEFPLAAVTMVAAAVAALPAALAVLTGARRDDPAAQLRMAEAAP